MQFASMSLGIFDFLIEWLTKFLIWVVQFALELVGQLISLILYGVCVQFLTIVDFIQKMFYKLCGLGSYWVNGVEMKETDPLLSIITDKSVLQILLALTLVAVAMVIVATIIQVLRTEFSTEGSKNTKGQVFGQAIKALVMFALVPICSAGGILITNALLKAVNTATSLGAESSVGGAVYVASTYSANHIRNGGTIQSITPSTNGNYVIKVKGFSSFMSITKEKEYECTISGEAVSYLGGASLSVNQGNRDEIAQKIDNAFRSGYISFDDKSVANTFYDVGSINFVTFLGGGILAAYTMLMASFGMIMRMYKGAVLFVISPAMTGLMPLDNGGAFKQWRTAFIKQLLSAYGTIVAMNLLFILLPIVGNITLFEGSTGGAINAFVQMLFTLTGLFMLKDMSGMIANMIGADDAGAAGAGMAGKVLGTAAKIGTVAVGGVAGVAAKGLGAGAGALAKKTGKQGFAMAANTFGGLGNKMTQKAKGTAGKALNKISNVATGGEFKGPFSEEVDYDKAKEAKEKKITARASAVKNGTAGIGTYLGNKIDNIGDKRRENKAMAGSSGDTVDKMKKNAQQVGQVGLTTKSIDDIQAALKSGNSLEAGQSISALLEALNSIADKTEDQKDMIQKLTTLQGQVSTRTSANALSKLGNQSGFFDGLRTQTTNITETAAATSHVLKDYNVNINNNMETEWNKMAQAIQKEILSKNGSSSVSVAEIQKELLKMQSAVLDEKKSKK